MRNRNDEMCPGVVVRWGAWMLFALAAALPLRLCAQTLYYDTGTGTAPLGGAGVWSTNASDLYWGTNTTLSSGHTRLAWSNGYDANFTVLGPVTVNDVTANSIRQGAATAGFIVLSGPGPLTLGGGGIFINDINNCVRPSCPIVLGADQTWASANAYNVATMPGPISGTGMLTLGGAGSVGAYQLTNTSSALNGLTTYGPGGYGVGGYQKGLLSQSIPAGILTNGVLTLGVPGGSAVNGARLTIAAFGSATSVVSTLTIASPAGLTSSNLTVGTVARLGHATLQVNPQNSATYLITNGLAMHNNIVSPWLLGIDWAYPNDTKPFTYSAGTGLAFAALRLIAQFDSACATQNVKASVAFSMNGNAAAQVLSTAAYAVNLNGNTLTIGDGTYAGLIINGGAITNSGASGAMDFGAAEGLVYVPDSVAGSIFVPILGTNGLVKFGPGYLTLQSSNLYSGPIWVNDGVLTLSPTVDLTLSNNIMGPGCLAKSGASRLTLSGTNVVGFRAAINTTTYNNAILGGTLCFSGGSCTNPGTASGYVSPIAYFGAPNCAMLVMNGAQLFLPAPNFGAATNCSIVVTGSGTLWNMLGHDAGTTANTANTSLGGSNCSFTVANDAVVTNNTGFTMLAGSANCSLTITNGGRFCSGTSATPGSNGGAYNAFGIGHSIFIGGTDTVGQSALWNYVCSSATYAFRLGDGNTNVATALGQTMTVGAGGVYNGYLTVGARNGMSNTLTVTDGGSVVTPALTVGYIATNCGNIALVQNGGILEAGTLTISTPGNFITNNGGIFQFTSLTPTITPNGPGSIAMNNGTISFRGFNTVDVKGNQGSGTGIKTNNLAWSGANALRLNFSSNTIASSQTYVFDPNMGATNYARLEMVNGSTCYGGMAGNSLSIGQSVGSGGSMLCSNTAALVTLAFTNNGTLTVFNSTLMFTNNATFNGTLVIDSDHLASLAGVVLASNLTLGASSSLVVTGHGTNATLITYASLSGNGAFGSVTVPPGYSTLRPLNGQVLLVKGMGTGVFFH